VGKFVYFYIKIDFLKALQIWGKKLSLIFPFEDIKGIAFSQNLSILKKFLIQLHLFSGRRKYLILSLFLVTKAVKPQAVNLIDTDTLQKLAMAGNSQTNIAQSASEVQINGNNANIFHAEGSKFFLTSIARRVK
jgi:hypothetical protein